MDHPLWQALTQLGGSLWELLVVLFLVLVPWAPLAAWIIFWLFAVNWIKLRETFAKGAWVGLVLIGALAVLIWGSISPGTGTFDFFGLHVSNFVEKTIFVSGLYVIMFLAGALQLSGFCADCCRFEEPVQIADHGHPGGHGHDAGHSPAPAAAHGAHH